MTNINVAEVAKYQRWLILAILAQIIMLVVAIVVRVNAGETTPGAAPQADPATMLVGLIQLGRV